MKLVTDLREWRTIRKALKGSIGFVPTMGHLHEGHASLCARARSENDIVVASIFVNPTQFNEPADYQRYPRTLNADEELCRRCGASVVYAPAASDVYPPGVSIEVPSLPRVATEPRLEDAARPGHFAGVCQVVMRLFRLVRPAVGVFGEKDWQQLQVVRAMVAHAGLAIDIVGMATVREADGLALSSRNRFLSPEDRRRGLTLSRALTAAGRAGGPEEAERVMARLLAEEGISPDYAVVRDAASLGPVRHGAARALIAARVGSVRLLDNMPWPNPAP